MGRGEMSRYAVLILPSANRVYADAAIALTQAELGAFNQSVLGGRIGAIATECIGGVPYVSFECDDIGDRDISFLANLSSLYALFAVEDELLRPVTARGLDRLDDDLITIQKYSGKTNEQFTKLLLNVTVLASDFASGMLNRSLTVLDPLCGRGTTLNQALMYGWNAYGIEIDERDVDAYAVFIQRWVKEKRLKHRVEYGPVRRDRRVVARRLELSFAARKDDYRAGIVQRLDVVNADTSSLPEFFRPASVDLVVMDAPYGVQHGSRTKGRELSRSPLELIADNAPAWARVLRPGGAVGIAWNTHVARRDDAAEALESAGLRVVEPGAQVGFSHRVDQAIQRDIIIARKARD
ncbi:MAG: TRM11 family SAM-dependent methyltransferase [Candidatus Nanopelagicales bacterium]